MPTLVDSLIVELGLDPTEFTQGEKDAVAALADLRQKGARQAKEVEDSYSKIADGFETMGRKVLGFTAGLFGGYAIGKFIRDTIDLNRQLGITADVTGETTARLSTLSGAFERMGGSGENVLNVITKWTNELYAVDIAAMNPQQSHLIRLLNALSIYGIKISSTDAGGKWRKTTDIFIDIAEAIAKADIPDDRKIGLLRESGLDDATISRVLKGGVALRDFLKEQEKIFQVTDEQRQASDKLNKSLRTLEQTSKGLGQQALRELAPVITDVMTALSKFVKYLEEELKRPTSIFYIPIVGGIFQWLLWYNYHTRGQVPEGYGGGGGTPTPGTPERTGVENQRLSGANYFGGKPLPGPGELTMVPTPYGVITVNTAAASDYKGFYDFLHSLGAPLKRIGSYSARNKRWGGGPSMHAYGGATDMDDQQYLSPEMRKWIMEHPDQWREGLRRFHMRWGGDWKSVYDPGHVEWGGPNLYGGEQQPAPEPKTPTPTYRAIPFMPTFRLPSSSSTNNTKTEINTVTVNTQATDAAAIAADVAAELKKQINAERPSQRLLRAKTPAEARAALEGSAAAFR